MLGRARQQSLFRQQGLFSSQFTPHESKTKLGWNSLYMRQMSSRSVEDDTSLSSGIVSAGDDDYSLPSSVFEGLIQQSAETAHVVPSMLGYQYSKGVLPEEKVLRELITSVQDRKAKQYQSKNVNVAEDSSFVELVTRQWVYLGQLPDFTAVLLEYDVEAVELGLPAIQYPGFEGVTDARRVIDSSIQTLSHTLLTQHDSRLTALQARSMVLVRDPTRAFYLAKYHLEQDQYIDFAAVLEVAEYLSVCGQPAAALLLTQQALKRGAVPTVVNTAILMKASVRAGVLDGVYTAVGMLANSKGWKPHHLDHVQEMLITLITHRGTLEAPLGNVLHLSRYTPFSLTEIFGHKQFLSRISVTDAQEILSLLQLPERCPPYQLPVLLSLCRRAGNLDIAMRVYNSRMSVEELWGYAPLICKQEAGQQSGKYPLHMERPEMVPILNDGKMVSAHIALNNLVYKMKSLESCFISHDMLEPESSEDKNSVFFGEALLLGEDIRIMPFSCAFEPVLLEFPATPNEDIYPADAAADTLLSGTFALQVSQLVPAWAPVLYSWMAGNKDNKYTQLIRTFKKENVYVSRWESDSVDVMMQLLLQQNKPKSAFVFLETYLHSIVSTGRVIPVVDLSPDDATESSMREAMQKDRKQPCFVGYTHAALATNVSPLQELVGMTHHALMRQPVYWNSKLLKLSPKLKEMNNGRDVSVHGYDAKTSDAVFQGVALAGAESIVPISGVDSQVLHALSKDEVLLDVDPARLTSLPISVQEYKGATGDVCAVRTYLHGMSNLAAELTISNPALAWEIAMYTQEGVSGATLSTHAPITTLPTHSRGTLYPAQVFNTLDGKLCPRASSFIEGSACMPPALTTASPFVFAPSGLAMRNWANNRWVHDFHQSQYSPLSLIQFNSDLQVVGAFSPLHSKCMVGEDGLVISTLSQASSLPLAAALLARFSIAVAKTMNRSYMAKFQQYITAPLTGQQLEKAQNCPDGNLLAGCLAVPGKTALYAMVSPHWTSSVHTDFRTQTVLLNSDTNHSHLSLDSVGLLPESVQDRQDSVLVSKLSAEETPSFPDMMNVAHVHTPVNAVGPQSSGVVLPTFPLAFENMEGPFIAPGIRQLATEEHGINCQLLAKNIKTLVHGLVKQQEYNRAAQLVLCILQRDTFKYADMAALHDQQGFEQQAALLYQHLGSIKEHAEALHMYILCAQYKDVGLLREWTWLLTMFGHVQAVYKLWSAYYTHSHNSLGLPSSYISSHNSLSSYSTENNNEVTVKLRAKCVFPITGPMSSQQIGELDGVPNVTLRELKQFLEHGSQEGITALSTLPRILGMALPTAHMGSMGRGFFASAMNNTMVKRHFLFAYRSDIELVFYQLFRDLQAVNVIPEFEAMDGISLPSPTAMALKQGETSLFEMLASQVGKHNLPAAFPWTSFSLDMLTHEQQLKLLSEVLAHDDRIASMYAIEMFSHAGWRGEFHSSTTVAGLGAPIEHVASLFHEDPLVKVSLQVRLGLETYIELEKPDLGFRYFLRTFQHHVWARSQEQLFVTLGATEAAKLLKKHPLFTLAQYYLASQHVKFPSLAFQFYRLCITHGLFAPFLAPEQANTGTSSKGMIIDSISAVLGRKLGSTAEGVKKPEYVHQTASTDSLGSHVVQAVIASSNSALREHLYLRLLAQTATGVPLLLQNPYGRRFDADKSTQVYTDESLRKVASGDFSNFGPFYHPLPHLSTPYVSAVAREDHYVDRGLYLVNLEDLTQAGKLQLGVHWTRLLLQNRDMQSAYEVSPAPQRPVSLHEMHEKNPGYVLFSSNIPETSDPSAQMQYHDAGNAGLPRDVLSGKTGFPFGLCYIPFSSSRRPCDLTGYWAITSLYTAKYIQEFKLGRFIETPAGFLRCIRAVESELALHQLQMGETPEHVNNESIDASNIAKLGKWSNERAIIGYFLNNVITGDVDKQQKIQDITNDQDNNVIELSDNTSPITEADLSLRKTVIRVDMTNPDAMSVVTKLSYGMQRKSNISLLDAKNVLHYRHRAGQKGKLSVLDQLAYEEAQEKDMQNSMRGIMPERPSNIKPEQQTSGKNHNNSNSLGLASSANTPRDHRTNMPSTKGTERFPVLTPSGVQMNRYVHRYRSSGAVFRTRAKWLEEHKTGYDSIRPAFLSVDQKNQQQQRMDKRSKRHSQQESVDKHDKKKHTLQ